MRIARIAGTAVLAGLVSLGPARATSAELTSDDGCTASGTWTNGLVVDATQKGTVTVPRSDAVQWKGSVRGAPGAYSGSVWIELPPPFGTVEIKSWKGNSTTTSNSGSEKYDIPSLVPGGVVFTVAGQHVDANGTCAGKVDLQLDGGAFGSPLTWVSLVGTLASGAGLLALLKPLFRTAVRTVK